MRKYLNITANEVKQLCAATRRQVAASGGNEACTYVSGIDRHQTFSDYQNTEQTAMMPIDIMTELTRESGDVSVLRTLARLVGYEIVALPQLPSSFADLQLAMGKTSKEVGEVFTRIGESLSDGTFDQKERADSTKEIDDAIAALVALRQVVGAGE